MNCKDMQTQAVCLRMADGSTTSAVAHYEYGLTATDAVTNTSTRFTDATGALVYDISLFESVTVGECVSQSQCVESQEWTYGIDNSGTRFDDLATYCLELSDGSTLEWSQDGSSSSWTPQLQEWSANIQTAADSAGLQWFVEPRFINNDDPSNIDGNLNSGSPSGLPGAPSVPIAEALAAGGMQWRYVNFQICPGQPVPVRAYRKTSQQFGNDIYELTTAGAVLGPVQKFWICIECGEEPVWFLQDGVTRAEAGQIPNCWEPCGTLTLADSPPDRTCEFFFAEACDNVNEPENDAIWINLVTRRATVCQGEQIAVDYFIPDANDQSALVIHGLIGQFVDCDTGLEVPLPETDEPKERLVTPECLVKRTIQVGYDNGRTPGSSTNDGGAPVNLVRFNENFTVLGWEVNGSQYGQGHRLENFAGWTPQLEGWAAFKSQFDPNQSTAEFAFLPSPTWRHCQLTTCDPRAVYGPIKLQRDDGVIFDVYPVPSISFASYEYAYRYTAVDCDDNKRVIWCDSEGNELEAPEDADCYVPCGFNFGPYINSADAPNCNEKVIDLCDQTDAGPVNFVLVITDCGGKRTRDRWTTDSYASAADPDGLVPYNVVGQIINCETGEPYVEPPPPCDDFVITEVFAIEGKTPGLRNREWTTEDPVFPFGTDGSAKDYLDAFDFNQAPTLDTVVTNNTAFLNDSNNTALVLDIQRREGFICLDKPITMRYSTNSEGAVLVELGKCCGDYEELLWYPKNVGNVPSEVFTIPAGIHKLRLTNMDSGGSNSSWTPASSNDGVDFNNDNGLLDDFVSTTQPSEICKKVKVCKPGGTLVDLFTGAEVDPSDCYACPIQCEPCCSSASDAGATALPLTARIAQ